MSLSLIHIFGSADVRGVHVAVDVGFDGGVDGDNTESAHHFRSTMDLDATIKGANVNVEDIENLISSIIIVFIYFSNINNRFPWSGLWLDWMPALRWIWMQP